jgi:Asp-tRNA(Asn)/Glu-tRNA(Gln) amidotransferase A subunit family amidase
MLRLTGALVLAFPMQLPAQKFELMETTIAGVHAAFASGRLTCRALVQSYLDRIAAYDKSGPALNAIQFVNPRALEQADSLDAVWRGKTPRGSLHCVPVLLKDQVETSTMPTTYGSALFKDFIPKRDATIVRRLTGAGAIILAKTTMGEFASRFVGSAFGVVRNAYDPTRNPSGSSGGSASGVAANFGLVGIGEDTGGSIRGPAAVSSLVGLRPTTPLVSRFGMMPANPSQDTMGPMTRCVADAARILDVIAGYDPNDPVTAETIGNMPASYLSALKPDALKGARIGVLRSRRDSATVARAPEEYAKVRTVFDQAMADLRKLGVEVVDSFAIPTLNDRRVGNDFETEQATDAYLAQHPDAPVKTLKEILLAGTVNPWRARGMMDLVGRRTTDPGYLTVMQQRAALRVAVLKAMADARLDAIVYATYDAPPTPIADDVLTNPRTADAYGRGDNRGLSPTIGFPALTVPAGFTSDSLPVGLELLGRPYTEAALLGYAFAYEQATRHRRPPPTTPSLRLTP